MTPDTAAEFMKLWQVVSGNTAKLDTLTWLISLTLLTVVGKWLREELGSWHNGRKCKTNKGGP